MSKEEKITAFKGFDKDLADTNQTSKRDRKRANNLEDLKIRLEQALDLVSRMSARPFEPININNAPYKGVRLLEKLEAVEVFESNIKTSEDGKFGDTLMIACTRRAG